MTHIYSEEKIKKNSEDKDDYIFGQIWIKKYWDLHDSLSAVLLITYVLMKGLGETMCIGTGKHIQEYNEQSIMVLIKIDFCGGITSVWDRHTLLWNWSFS